MRHLGVSHEPHIVDDDVLLVEGLPNHRRKPFISRPRLTGQDGFEAVVQLVIAGSAHVVGYRWSAARR